MKRFCKCNTYVLYIVLNYLNVYNEYKNILSKLRTKKENKLFPQIILDKTKL